MNKEKVIETLEDLRDYVNDEWDADDFADDIKNANEALDYAIAKLVSDNEEVGILSLNGKKYAIKEIK